MGDKSGSTLALVSVSKYACRGVCASSAPVFCLVAALFGARADKTGQEEKGEVRFATSEAGRGDVCARHVPYPIPFTECDFNALKRERLHFKRRQCFFGETCVNSGTRVCVELVGRELSPSHGRADYLRPATPSAKAVNNNMETIKALLAGALEPRTGKPRPTR